ncbi:MAG: urease accessory protein UreE [Tissierellaceae bacterium]|nr:urease accessory protein UreE [Tissierellaceae bacterium]
MNNRIITKVKGSIKDKEFEGLSINYVDIPWYDSGKRIQKLITNKGNNIGIRLDSVNINRGLLQGDVLEVIDGEAIAINIIEDKCIAVKANDLQTVAKVCYEIGNRHSPLFYSEDYSELILPYDKPIHEMLKKLEVDASVKTMKIHRDRSISSVNTSHQHSHDTDHTHHHSHSHDTEHSHHHGI